MMRQPAMPAAGGPARWLFAAALALSGGCGTTTPVRHYLVPPSPAGSAAAAISAGYVLGLGPVTLPEYLSRPQMAIRDSAAGIRYHDGHRWAEPLADNVRRVLKENLAGALGSDAILAYPWPRSRAVDVQVTVEITRFDADTAGVVTLAGHWAALDGSGASLLAPRPVAITTAAAAPAPEAIAVAHGSALAQLARDIGAALATSLPIH